ncbi:MAG TPA: hypothetical protein VF271_01030 [Rhodanobacteraceae bacterium]
MVESIDIIISASATMAKTAPRLTRAGGVPASTGTSAPRVRHPAAATDKFNMIEGVPADVAGKRESGNGRRVFYSLAGRIPHEHAVHAGEHRRAAKLG